MVQDRQSPRRVHPRTRAGQSAATTERKASSNPKPSAAGPKMTVTTAKAVSIQSEVTPEERQVGIVSESREITYVLERKLRLAAEAKVEKARKELFETAKRTQALEAKLKDTTKSSQEEIAALRAQLADLQAQMLVVAKNAGEARAVAEDEEKVRHEFIGVSFSLEVKNWCFERGDTARSLETVEYQNAEECVSKNFPLFCIEVPWFVGKMVVSLKNLSRSVALTRRAGLLFAQHLGAELGHSCPLPFMRNFGAHVPGIFSRISSALGENHDPIPTLICLKSFVEAQRDDAVAKKAVLKLFAPFGSGMNLGREENEILICVVAWGQIFDAVNLLAWLPLDFPSKLENFLLLVSQNLAAAYFEILDLALERELEFVRVALWGREVLLGRDRETRKGLALLKSWGFGLRGLDFEDVSEDVVTLAFEKLIKIHPNEGLRFLGAPMGLQVMCHAVIVVGSSFSLRARCVFGSAFTML